MSARLPHGLSVSENAVSDLPGPRLQDGIAIPKSTPIRAAVVINTGPGHVTLVGVVGAAESPSAVREVDPNVEPTVGRPWAGGISAGEDS